VIRPTRGLPGSTCMLGRLASLKLGSCGTPPTPLEPRLSVGGREVESVLELDARELLSISKAPMCVLLLARLPPDDSPLV
jgi:hypothetical protein